MPSGRLKRNIPTRRSPDVPQLRDSSGYSRGAGSPPSCNMGPAISNRRDTPSLAKTCFRCVRTVLHWRQQPVVSAKQLFAEESVGAQIDTRCSLQYLVPLLARLELNERIHGQDPVRTVVRSGAVSRVVGASVLDQAPVMRWVRSCRPVSQTDQEDGKRDGASRTTPESSSGGQETAHDAAHKYARPRSRLDGRDGGQVLRRHSRARQGGGYEPKLREAVSESEGSRT